MVLKYNIYSIISNISHREGTDYGISLANCVSQFLVTTEE